MKETFPQRPTFPAGRYPDGEARANAIRGFEQDDYNWLKKLAEHPHVQAVMHIPPSEPIFVLRAQDKHASRIITEWLLVADANGGLSEEKYNAAATDRNAIEQWHIAHPDLVKQPD